MFFLLSLRSNLVFSYAVACVFTSEKIQDDYGRINLYHNHIIFSYNLY